MSPLALSSSSVPLKYQNGDAELAPPDQVIQLSFEPFQRASHSDFVGAMHSACTA
jgi:hypothetical protein